MSERQARAERKFLISKVKSKQDNVPRLMEVGWGELNNYIDEVVAIDCDCEKDPALKSGKSDRKGCKLKDIEGWVPGTFHEMVHNGPTSKNFGQFGLWRLKDASTHLSLIVFDLDHRTRAQMEIVFGKLDGYQYIVYSTHGHDPDNDDCCYRIVLIPDRDILASEWDAFWPRAVAYMGLQDDIDYSCTDQNRFYYRHCFRRAAGIKAEKYETFEGRMVPFDEVMKLPAPPPRVTAKVRIRAKPSTPHIPQPGKPAAEDDVTPSEYMQDLFKKLRGTLKAFKNAGNEDSAAILEPVIKHTAAAPEGMRNTILHRLMHIIAFSLHSRKAPVEYPVIETLMRQSLGAMYLEDGCNYESNHCRIDHGEDGRACWNDYCERKYYEACAKKEAKEEAESNPRNWVSAGIPQSAPAAGQVPSGAPPPFPGQEPDVQPTGTPEVETVETVDDYLDFRQLPWSQMLEVKLTKDGDEKVNKQRGLTRNDAGELVRGVPDYQDTKLNISLILNNDPRWTKAFRFNDVLKTPECVGGPLTASQRDLLVVHDHVGNWLDTFYGIEPKTGVIENVIRDLAWDNQYDPIREYLLALKWDGQPRINTMLQTYFNAVTTTPSGQDITPYVQLVSRRFPMMLGIRGLCPGSKVDTMVVLESEIQGEKKTQAVEILGGAFFADGGDEKIAEKDIKQLMAVNWLVELGEMGPIRAASYLSAKSFLSRRSDKYRPPYGYGPKDFPRRCVLIGTTNQRNYLTDDQNRRYLPVGVGNINLVALARDRDQLYAEAVDILLRGGHVGREEEKGLEGHRRGEPCQPCKATTGGRCTDHRWWLEGEEILIAEKEAGARRNDAGEPYKVAIIRWFIRKDIPARPDFVDIHTIGREALGMTDVDKVVKNFTQIADALREMGFVKDGRRYVKGEANTSEAEKKSRPMVWLTPEHILESKENIAALSDPVKLNEFYQNMMNAKKKHV